MGEVMTLLRSLSNWLCKASLVGYAFINVLVKQHIWYYMSWYKYCCSNLSPHNQPWAYRLTIYGYANIVWFSKYRWNIVIAFFLTISQDIFRQFLPIYFLPIFTCKKLNFRKYLLIKISSFEINRDPCSYGLWFHASKNDFIFIIWTFSQISR